MCNLPADEYVVLIYVPTTEGLTHVTNATVCTYKHARKTTPNTFSALQVVLKLTTQVVGVKICAA